MAVSATRNEQLRRYVENRHIDHIPAGARHGKPWHQFAFWFGGNVNVFNVVLGAVTVSIGLTFWWALIAIAAGTLIGALLIALHATQGPRLGVPQSIQSRGQFGFYGSAFMFPAVLLLNVGFIAAELVIQAQAMNGVTSALSIPPVDPDPSHPLGGDRDLRLPVDPLGHAGHRHHRRRGADHHAHPGPALRRAARPRDQHGPCRRPACSWPESRCWSSTCCRSGRSYPTTPATCPRSTSGRRLFWGIYAGNVLATFFSCAVGAYLGALLPSARPGRRGRQGVGVVGAGHHGGVADQREHLQRLHRLVPGAGVRQHVAAVQGRVGDRAAGPVRVRDGGRGGDRVPGVPVVRHQPDQLPGRPAGHLHPLVRGQPGRLLPGPPRPLRRRLVLHRRTAPTAGSPGAGCWPTRSGLAAEWPFVSQPDYTGPLVKTLGGADISWLAGWFAAAIVYLLLVALVPGTAARRGQPITAGAR